MFLKSKIETWDGWGRIGKEKQRLAVYIDYCLHSSSNPPPGPHLYRDLDKTVVLHCWNLRKFLRYPWKASAGSLGWESPSEESRTNGWRSTSQDSTNGRLGVQNETFQRTESPTVTFSPMRSAGTWNTCRLSVCSLASKMHPFVEWPLLPQELRTYPVRSSTKTMPPWQAKSSFTWTALNSHPILFFLGAERVTRCSGLPRGSSPINPAASHKYQPYQRCKDRSEKGENSPSKRELSSKDERIHLWTVACGACVVFLPREVYLLGDHQTNNDYPKGSEGQEPCGLLLEAEWKNHPECCCAYGSGE